MKCTPQYMLGYGKNDINDEEILYNRGYYAKAPRSVFGHICKGGDGFRISEGGFRNETIKDIGMRVGGYLTAKTLRVLGNFNHGGL
jgi:hypothetical protein